MGKFIKGEVVVLPFPFSNLSGSKKRPALVLSDLSGDDIILCQITSQNTDNNSMLLDESSFSSGSLPVISYIRPTRIFTADKNIIIRKAGVIKESLRKEVINTIIDLMK